VQLELKVYRVFKVPRVILVSKVLKEIREIRAKLGNKVQREIKVTLEPLVQTVQTGKPRLKAPTIGQPRIKQRLLANYLP
jgi:hypothetical protein